MFEAYENEEENEAEEYSSCWPCSYDRFSPCEHCGRCGRGRESEDDE